MTILTIEPNRKPVVQEIEDRLEAMQAIVGGMIQAVYPFNDPVAVICNDEGKLLGLPQTAPFATRILVKYMISSAAQYSFAVHRWREKALPACRMLRSSITDRYFYVLRYFSTPQMDWSF